MSEVFMTIHNDSRLYKDYFEWRNGFKNMVDTANRVMDQFGIESKRASVVPSILTHTAVSSFLAA